MNLAIIGCGEIGQRHFESVLNLDYKMKIFLIDKSTICLEKCKQISLKKKRLNFFYFATSVSEIEEDFDFVIVATNSDHRFSVLKELYMYKNPKFIILEKFLFNKLSHFNEAKKLFQLNSTKVWVNQWMSTDFPNLSDIFSETDGINISVKGKNWNFCSNCVHWLEWFHHINNRKKIVLFNSSLENVIIENKRKGFFETFGSLEFHGINNNKLFLKCNYEKNSERETLISLSNKSSRAEFQLTVNSLKGFIYKSNQKKSINFKFRYLSERTSVYIKSILEKNECTLPTYDQSVLHHKLVFQTLKNHFDKSYLKTSNLLPIT
jgi:hypothetical protein